MGLTEVADRIFGRRFDTSKWPYLRIMIAVATHEALGLGILVGFWVGCYKFQPLRQIIYRAPDPIRASYDRCQAHTSRIISEISNDLHVWWMRTESNIVRILNVREQSNISISEVSETYDIVLIFEEEEKAQVFLDELTKVIPSFGMHFAPKKCKLVEKDTELDGYDGCSGSLRGYLEMLRYTVLTSFETVFPRSAAHPNELWISSRTAALIEARNSTSCNKRRLWRAHIPHMPNSKELEDRYSAGGARKPRNEGICNGNVPPPTAVRAASLQQKVRNYVPYIPKSSVNEAWHLEPLYGKFAVFRTVDGGDGAKAYVVHLATCAILKKARRKVDGVSACVDDGRAIG
ncbi:hypothetical protein CLF_112185 [Clonorchis sinensis]|uniref:Uncharacterized protein n=1 Tax=Clonorchis sinensis TaxID=79923 RepID=G7YMC5_CLOSI|nr:hypothetical protein CLF_112185 [Clonorchis sinensis]